MSEAKFTKGPWEWKGAEACEDGYIDDCEMPKLKSGNALVMNFGNCEQYYPTEGTPPNEHDAHLIAAAPEMYEMLQSLLDAQGTIHHPTTRVTINRLLSKARGESNE